MLVRGVWHDNAVCGDRDDVVCSKHGGVRCENGYHAQDVQLRTVCTSCWVSGYVSKRYCMCDMANANTMSV